MKDLVFKERLTKKLVNWYMSLYTIKEIVFTNIVKLQLLTLMRIHLIVNITWIVQYREPIEGQKVKEAKPVKVEGVEEWEVKKILNKRKVRWVIEYLVQ